MGKVEIPFQVQTYDRRSGMTEVLNYGGWMSGMQIDDDYFAPDPRTELQEFSYEEYVLRSRAGPVGPAPVLYKNLLHGEGE